MAGSKWLFVPLAAAALVVGGALALRHQQAEVLRTELALARDEQRELAALRAENRRLAAQQLSAAELERLRADRAAVLRLRAEVDALRARTEQMERSVVTAPAPAPAPPAAPAAIAPALALKLEADAAGGLSLGERTLDYEALRQQLAGTARGSRVDVTVRLPDDGKVNGLAELNGSVRRLMGFARELGLRMEVRFERPAFTVPTPPPAKP